MMESLLMVAMEKVGLPFYETFSGAFLMALEKAKKMETP